MIHEFPSRCIHIEYLSCFVGAQTLLNSSTNKHACKYEYKQDQASTLADRAKRLFLRGGEEVAELVNLELLCYHADILRIVPHWS